ncbi:MAG: NTP transferase domain-containing protein [Hyphomicrobium sp.]
MSVDQQPLIVILAAGKGTRMKSELPKVMHRIAGRSMIGHVLDVALQLQTPQIAVVVGPEMQDVVEEAKSIAPHIQIFEQKHQLGTAHAVLSAEGSLQSAQGPILILYGDTPLIQSQTLRSLCGSLKEREGVSVLGFEAKDPTGYGRLLLDKNGTLRAIREQKEASLK